MACALTKATPGRRPRRRGDVSRRRRVISGSRRNVAASSLAVAATSPQSPWSPVGRGAFSSVADKISLRDIAATAGDVSETC